MTDLSELRGYAIIGLQEPSKKVNIGHALRAAGALNARMIVIANAKYDGTITDTSKAYRHIPLINTNDMREVIPYDCTPVAVEMTETAIPLPEYRHPERAFYIFGSELGVLNNEVISYCKDVIQIPSNFSLNLGVTVNIVLYDRIAKQIVVEKGVRNRKEIFRRTRNANTL